MSWQGTCFLGLLLHFSYSRFLLFLLFTRGPRYGGQAPGHSPFHLNPHFKLRLSRSQMPGPGSCSQNIQQLHSCPLALGCLLLWVGRFLKAG